MQAYTEGKSQSDFAKLNGLPTPGIKFNIYVCGSETLSLTAAGNIAQFLYEPTPASTTKKFNLDYRSWFSIDTTTSHARCGITRYWVGGCLPQFADTVYSSGNSKFYIREQNAILSNSGKQWFYAVNYDISGYALQNHNNVPSDKECADKCEAHGSCKGFRYRLSDKTCNLKSSSVKLGASTSTSTSDVKDWYEPDPLWGEFNLNLLP